MQLTAKGGIGSPRIVPWVGILLPSTATTSAMDYRQLKRPYLSCKPDLSKSKADRRQTLLKSRPPEGGVKRSYSPNICPACMELESLLRIGSQSSRPIPIHEASLTPRRLRLIRDSAVKSMASQSAKTVSRSSPSRLKTILIFFSFLPHTTGIHICT